jgi:hypothetical protein
MNAGENSAPLGADRSLLASTDTLGFAGIRYIWVDGDSWSDGFAWKD